MKRLTNREMQALLQGISTLHSKQDHESLHARIYSTVNQVVPGEFFALDYFRARGDWLSADSSTNPSDVIRPGHAEVFVAHAAQHPLFGELLRTGLAAPRKVTDFVTTSQFHRYAIYNEFYRDVGVDRQIAVGFPAGPEVTLLLTLNRSCRDFGEGDRQLLTLLRPHMILACQNAVFFTSLQLQCRNLDGALETAGVGAIMVDMDGRETLVTEQARAWLGEYFGRPHGHATELPEEIKDWIARYVSVATRGEVTAGSLEPLEIEREGGRLRIRPLIDRAANHILLLMEEQIPIALAACEKLGLTRREAEVLSWVALGKSNPEIAILCEISARTVQKHLEHIYQKLGVETRTAAAREALALGKRRPRL